MQNVIVNSVLSENDNITKKELFTYLSMLLQLDSLTYNITKEFEEKLKNCSLFKQEIKKNINVIYEKLKKTPKCRWGDFTDEEVIAFGDDGEVIELVFKRLFGLEKGKNVCVVPQHAVGDKVWTIYNDQPTLSVIDSIEIKISITSSVGAEDNSYYCLEVLDPKLKRTGVVLHRGESDVHKSKKKLYENIKK